MSSARFTFDMLAEGDPVLVAIRTTADLDDKTRCIAEFESFLVGTPSCSSELRYWDADGGSAYCFTWQLSQEPIGLTHWYPDEFISRFKEATWSDKEA